MKAKKGFLFKFNQKNQFQKLAMKQGKKDHIDKNLYKIMKAILIKTIIKNLVSSKTMKIVIYNILNSNKSF